MDINMKKLKNPVIISEYSDIYKEGVINLILNIQQNEFNIQIKKEDQPDLCDIPEFYQKNRGNFWVALSDDRVVGTVSLLDIGSNQSALRKMFVQKEFRGKAFNIAEGLLIKLLDWSQKNKINEIFLGTTDKFLAAHRFYEKNKFIKIPKENLPASFPIMKVDTIFYKYIV
jgi:GNAT superfamily N-acetyltransferase